MPRQPLGQRVHAWLNEPDGETFRLGKWRFWFIAVAGLQLLNAGLTALIFDSVGNLQNYMGAILLGVGALVGWIAIGCLHYSDSGDRILARGVSALDSVTLLFVIAHFAFLMWAYGHLKTIQSAEAKYEAQAERFNAEARQVQDANVKIAEAARQIAAETTKAERLRNDTAYQTRKAAEAGAVIRAPRSASASGVGAGLTTSAVELERPVKPEKTSAQFLTEWDAWIRAANFGELLLCALTLIFIRNTTARSNSPRSSQTIFDGPLSVTNRIPAPVGNLTKKKEPQKNHGSFNIEGLKILREVLRDISFRLHKRSFKSAVRGDAVWIYLMRANNGTQEAESSAKARLSLLDDAVAMEREAFRDRLEKFLRSNGFEI